MKKNYQTPQIIQINIDCEGMLAQSNDYIPIKPSQPGTAATNKNDRCWGKDIWESNE